MMNDVARFEVVATQWVPELEKQAEVVVGRFDSFFYAKMFADAYNEHFKSNAHIVEYKRVYSGRV